MDYEPVPRPTFYAELLMQCLRIFSVGWVWQHEHKLVDPIIKRTFYLDLYERRSKLAVELNGLHHYTDLRQQERDDDKKRLADFLGIEIISIPNFYLHSTNDSHPLEMYFDFVGELMSRYFQRLGYTAAISEIKTTCALKKYSPTFDMLETDIVINLIELVEVCDDQDYDVE